MLPGGARKEFRNELLFFVVSAHFQGKTVADTHFAILAQKTAISSATIAVFRDFSLFFVVLDNPRRKYPRFFCEDIMIIIFHR